jgi:ADP-ribose pyrophosphatase YjhB (NUDIX family)
VVVADAASRRGVSGLIQRNGKILLVELQGLDDPRPAWSLPGGRVDAAEGWLEALRREIAEETGVVVGESPIEAFRIVAEDGSEWRTYSCLECSGELMPNDPDGEVLQAAWFPLGDALTHLEAIAWYDIGPLRAWIESRPDGWDAAISS